MRVWQPRTQPTIPIAHRHEVRPPIVTSIKSIPVTARAPWGPPQGNGWSPKISDDGWWIVYGFWQTFIADLRTGVEREITLPSGARLHPIGFINTDTAMAVTENPPAVYTVSTRDFKPVNVGVPPDLAIANWATAARGHYALNASTRPICVKDGRIFREDRSHQGVALAGNHLVTADPTRGGVLQHFIGDSLFRELPTDNLWVVNEQGDITTGYFGPVKLFRFDRGTMVEDATIAPWRQEGPGCPVRNGPDLWLWTPTHDGTKGFVIGRRLGEKDPIVVPIPAIAVSVVWNGAEWVVAGNDERGRLTVMWAPMDTPRTKLGREPNQPPICQIVYTRGEAGACPSCGHVKSVHRQKDPEPTLMYRDGNRDIKPYFVRRWNELGVPQKTKEVGERLGIRTHAEFKRIVETDRPRADAAERAFHEVQCPAIFQIVGELHWTHGMKDVGLSTKRAGINWNGFATDIVTQKPIDASGNVVGGNFILVDAVGAVGTPEPDPNAWHVLGENDNPARPWAEPPRPSAEEPGNGHTDPDPNPDPELREQVALLGAQQAQISGRVDGVVNDIDAIDHRLSRVEEALGGEELTEDRVRDLFSQMFSEKMRSLRVAGTVKPNGTGFLRHGHGMEIVTTVAGEEVSRTQLRDGDAPADIRTVASTDGEFWDPASVLDSRQKLIEDELARLNVVQGRGTDD